MTEMTILNTIPKDLLVILSCCIGLVFFLITAGTILAIHFWILLRADIDENRAAVDLMRESRGWNKEDKL